MNLLTALASLAGAAALGIAIGAGTVGPTLSPTTLAAIAAAGALLAAVGGVRILAGRLRDRLTTPARVHTPQRTGDRCGVRSQTGHQTGDQHQ